MQTALEASTVLCALGARCSHNSYHAVCHWAIAQPQGRLPDLYACLLRQKINCTAFCQGVVLGSTCRLTFIVAVLIVSAQYRHFNESMWRPQLRKIDSLIPVYAQRNKFLAGRRSAGPLPLSHRLLLKTARNASNFIGCSLCTGRKSKFSCTSDSEWERNRNDAVLFFFLPGPALRSCPLKWN